MIRKPIFKNPSIVNTVKKVGAGVKKMAAKRAPARKRRLMK